MNIVVLLQQIERERMIDIECSRVIGKEANILAMQRTEKQKRPSSYLSTIDQHSYSYLSGQSIIQNKEAEQCQCKREMVKVAASLESPNVVVSSPAEHSATPHPIILHSDARHKPNSSNHTQVDPSILIPPTHEHEVQSFILEHREHCLFHHSLFGYILFLKSSGSYNLSHIHFLFA